MMKTDTRDESCRINGIDLRLRYGAASNFTIRKMEESGAGKVFRLTKGRIFLIMDLSADGKKDEGNYGIGRSKQNS